MAALDTGVPQSTLNDPKGWSTLPKLIVYYLDKSITDQLATIGLKPGAPDGPNDNVNQLKALARKLWVRQKSQTT